MNPRHWGPHTWNYLHSLSFAYPVKPSKREQLQYKKFFETLKLPCYTCQENYKKEIKEIPVDEFLSTKMDLAYWVYLLHSSVNKRLKKKNLTFVEVLRIYIPKTVCTIDSKDRVKCPIGA